MPDCIFCKIIAGAAPGKIVYHDEQVTAFHDKHPVAPVHILVIPNRHVVSVNELEDADEALAGHLFTGARKLAREFGIQDSGYRLIVNTGPDSGQAVFHLHLHLIGGRHVRFPMG
jgi:histidine triad (HIT) family protein